MLDGVEPSVQEVLYISVHCTTVESVDACTNNRVCNPSLVSLKGIRYHLNVDIEYDELNVLSETVFNAGISVLEHKKCSEIPPKHT